MLFAVKGTMLAMSIICLFIIYLIKAEGSEGSGPFWMLTIFFALVYAVLENI